MFRYYLKLRKDCKSNTIINIRKEVQTFQYTFWRVTQLPFRHLLYNGSGLGGQKGYIECKIVTFIGGVQDGTRMFKINVGSYKYFLRLKNIYNQLFKFISKVNCKM